MLPSALSETWEVRGQVGDMFGAVNSLFSALALAGVLYTILLQRDELSLQRIELALTREELARAASAQEASERALAAQVRVLEATARLNAFRAMIEHYSQRRSNAGNVSAIQELDQKVRRYTLLLENEVESLADAPESTI
jgi:hypothetical protein